MQLLYTAVSFIGIAALLILEHIVRKSDTMTVSNKRFFCFSIWVVVSVMVAELITVFFEGPSSPYRIPHILGNVIGFAASPFIPLLVACAIGGYHKNSRFLFGIPSAINLILTIFSTRFPIIFWVDDANMYMRGRAFWVYILSYITTMLYLLFQTLIIIKSYQNSSRFIPIVLFFFVCAGTMGQIIFPWLHVSWLCISFSIVLYYVYYCDLLHQIDGITGLLNRRTYEYHVHRIKCEAKVAIVLFDVDEFKTVNDRYGHPFGDYCLTMVSSCIKKAFFKVGLCFRIGGDEFCVVVKKADIHTVEGALRRFLYEIELLRKAEDRLPMVSVGYSITDDKTPDISSTVFEADKNMYQFKRQRKESTQL